MTTTTEALASLETRASTLSAATLSQRVVDRLSGLLARRTSRRGFLVRAGVVGSAMAVDPVGYVLKPGTAYAAVCGPGTSCGSGWTVFCATINKGANACPPGSIAAGWWKADGASLCGGKARYIIDCNATCSKCTSPGSRAGICSTACWSCGCTCGPTSSCDQRKVCCNGFRYGQCNTQVRQVGGVQCRVVSCTPPWKFEACSTAPATDNRTRDHNSDALPQKWTPITARYTALGENGSVLGGTVYAELAVAGGRAQRYQNGRINQSAATGVQVVIGAIAKRYEAVGAEAGALRYPTAAEVAAPASGKAQVFQGGRISWTAATGAWETTGVRRDAYARARYEGGLLGYPVTSENPAAGGGTAQRFERGRISWSADTGAHWMGAQIAARYAELDAEGGVLGYPEVDEDEPRNAPYASIADKGSRTVRFQNGRLTYLARLDTVIVEPPSLLPAT